MQTIDAVGRSCPEPIIMLKKALATKEDSYVMEISSPGLDRPLKKPRDFERNLGKEVEIRTYKPIDRKKEFVGELVSFSDHSVVIRMDGEEKTFEKTDIALVRLYIEF